VTVRIGCLGAAKIAPAAVVKPARVVEGVEVVAIAARDRSRAEAFARRHGVPTVHDSYDAVVADPGVDAVYIPLPNGLHAEWTLKALDAGKHVLCEKPFTANAREAELVRAAADARPDLVVMEAFHWRYHPLAQRMVDIVRGGELGALRHVEASFCFPLFRRGDIRWRLDLAGGALMDAGCYAIHMVRTLAGAEPEVVAAEVRVRAADVDRWMRADLAFPDGTTGRITASMWSSTVLRISAGAVGERGRLHVRNPLAPHLHHRLTIERDGSRRREKVAGEATYTHQLRAFVAAVADGAPTLTPPSDSVATMRVIDDVYRAAGLAPRPGTVVGGIA
jgi:predicted dehydrogenase